MSLLHPSQTGAVVSLWLVHDIPVRLLHARTRYRVSDTPTRLEDDHPDLAYRLGIRGWRFQGTDDSGLSHMFEVRCAGVDALS